MVTSLESSTPRLDPELLPLLRLLSRADGFSLAFVRSNVPVESTRVARSLIDRLENEGRRGRILHLREPNVDLLQVIRDMQPPLEENESLFVLGFERSIPASKEIAPALARVNMVRECFRDLPGPLVLVLPDYALTQLSRQAPDFWAWRSGVFEVEVPEARVEEMFQELETHDPYRGLSTERKREHREVLTGLLAELEGGGPESRKKVQELLSRLAALSLSLREYEEAQKFAERALEMGREFGDEEAEAMALDLLARSHAGLGRRETALNLAQESVEIFRGLAEKQRVFLGGLATSLDHLSNHLAGLGHHQKAVTTAREAIKINRLLSERRPDLYLPNLAFSLHNCAQELASLGERKEALQTALDAVEIFQRLSDQRPGAFQAPLAASLDSLVGRYFEIKQMHAALETAEQALEIQRQLATQDPDGHLPDLAGSLANIAAILGAVGRHEEAVERASEAVHTLRPFFLRQPEAFELQMRNHFDRYQALLRAAGRRPDPELLREVEGISRANG